MSASRHGTVLKTRHFYFGETRHLYFALTFPRPITRILSSSEPGPRRGARVLSEPDRQRVFNEIGLFRKIIQTSRQFSRRGEEQQELHLFFGENAFQSFEKIVVHSFREREHSLAFMPS
jgi:hypothetical protein